MGGNHADLPFHLEALADHRREIVEDPRQVAARFPLCQHRGDEEPGVDDWHAAGKRPQGVRERHAEILPVVQQLELGANGIAELVGHHRQPRGKRVAGTQRASDQIDRLWKLLLELPHPFAGQVFDPPVRHQRGECANKRRNGELPADHPDRQSDAQPGNRARHQQSADRERPPGLIDEALEPLEWRDPAAVVGLREGQIFLARRV
jgi:hypothetical protein